MKRFILTLGMVAAVGLINVNAQSNQSTPAQSMEELIQLPFEELVNMDVAFNNETPSDDELINMSIEELMEIHVLPTEQRTKIEARAYVNDFQINGRIVNNIGIETLSFNY